MSDVQLSYVCRFSLSNICSFQWTFNGTIADQRRKSIDFYQSIMLNFYLANHLFDRVNVVTPIRLAAVACLDIVEIEIAANYLANDVIIDNWSREFLLHTKLCLPIGEDSIEIFSPQANDNVRIFKSCRGLMDELGIK